MSPMRVSTSHPGSRTVLSVKIKKDEDAFLSCVEAPPLPLNTYTLTAGENPLQAPHRGQQARLGAARTPLGACLEKLGLGQPSWLGAFPITGHSRIPSSAPLRPVCLSQPRGPLLRVMPHPPKSTFRKGGPQAPSICGRDAPWGSSPCLPTLPVTPAALCRLE